MVDVATLVSGSRVESFVFVAVLFAAGCHAGWNALIKVGLDPLSTTTLIAIGAAAVSFVCLPLAGMPASQAWPWLAASAIIHLLYFAALIESYRTGDLGQVYPIARGSAPLMTAIVSAALVGEHLNLLGWIGIVTLAAGVLRLSARGGRDIVQLDRRAVGCALLTALTICAYSVTDGIGVRLSRNPLGYVQWLFVANAIVLVPYALWRDRRSVTVAMPCARRKVTTPATRFAIVRSSCPAFFCATTNAVRSPLSIWSRCSLVQDWRNSFRNKLYANHVLCALVAATVLR